VVVTLDRTCLPSCVWSPLCAEGASSSSATSPMFRLLWNGSIRQVALSRCAFASSFGCVVDQAGVGFDTAVAAPPRIPHAESTGTTDSPGPGAAVGPRRACPHGAPLDTARRSVPRRVFV